MARWREFENGEPELAAFGYERLNDRVAYLATTRSDGAPRVHPVSARIREGGMFVRMYPSSPKAHDLLRDGRYALHSSVPDMNGTGGEFAISGQAMRVDDADVVERVNRGLPGEAARYVLFELQVDRAISTVYERDQEVRRRWNASG